MFSGGAKLMADLSGTADDNQVIPMSRIDATSEFLYFLQPDEVPLMLLKSRKGEYIFTDCAFITVMSD